MDGPVSAQARMLNLVLRFAVKPRLERDPDLIRLRREVDAMARVAPDFPRNVVRRPAMIGGVAAERHAATAHAGGRTLLYLHGGAFVAGSPRTHRGIAGRLARGVGAETVVPDYRLAPEHPFPAALDDALAVYEALLQECVAPGALALVGDSAGGNLAFALLLRLKEEGLPLPAAAVGLSPFVDMTGSGDSMSGNAGLDPFLDAAGLPLVFEAYAAGRDPRDPLLSPLFGDLAGLPPCFLQCGGSEILRDDAVRLHGALAAAGVAAKLEVWPEMPHVWQAFARFLPEARAAIARVVAFLDANMAPADKGALAAVA
ncbi:alpha/beta hydrolase [Methylopila jiangsuensis]|uniref:Alpha/beta hydrolase n=1 Tax=Methylopila jiangsuensis TaxID=586230 RepID=A0A9W6JE59_9HYPH|nr:alpha/beta hydrolase [Methylopila jiangsuensis]MDR6285844.1 acetyl esterase/lipase [Methylopila jiangsuensis]GLK75602.1 alpha/beta hydrolase [Methylopila jiangsuensis]